MPTKPVTEAENIVQRLLLKLPISFTQCLVKNDTNGYPQLLVDMLTTRGRQHPLTHCNSRKTHPHDAVTAGASAFSDPFGISATAHTHIIIMLKRSLVLITMQISLLFFHPINIIGGAYFL